jgi:hypothetical protein
MQQPCFNFWAGRYLPVVSTNQTETATQTRHQKRHKNKGTTIPAKHKLESGADPESLTPSKLFDLKLDLLATREPCTTTRGLCNKDCGSDISSLGEDNHGDPNLECRCGYLHK